MPTGARRATVFDQPVPDSGMRLVLRYDRVALLDQPNEAYAESLTEVSTGDEVEVLEVGDVWVRVRTPSGDEGWLPSVTVGAPPTPRVQEPW